MQIGASADQKVDEVRIEFPRSGAEGALLQISPKDWKLGHDGHAIILSGPVSPLPIRLRVTLFDLAPMGQVRVRLRVLGHVLSDERLAVRELSPLQATANVSAFLVPPAVVTPGDVLEMKVLDNTKTPADGQWVFAGVPATRAADRVRVTLPSDLADGSPLRVSFFDNWGERVVDALSVEDSAITASSTALVNAATPKITGCARFGFIGQSICVCGDFPPASWTGIRLDGQPATVITASTHVIRVALPDSLTPGPHEISGDLSAGFDERNKISILALRLIGSIDSNALLRGQSTTLRLGVEGTTESVKLAVSNKTPGVISIPGGNYQEINTPGGNNNFADRRVDAIARGNFIIDYSLDDSRCPCELGPQPNYVSTASRPAPVVVPRRILATIAIGTPAAMYATAQALALANGMTVLDVVPLNLTNEGLVTFEILDGINPVIKAIAIAADPRVTLAQPDLVYDTSQAPSPATDLNYGPRLTGLDLIQGISRGDGVRIGVVDTGIDTAHPSLRQSIAEYSDVTATGWTPDAHGSLVAGVISAAPSGSSGAVGVAPGAKLVAVKSCVAQSIWSAAARCWSSTLARGIDLAAQKNIRVMNLSVGGPDDKLLAHMVDAALQKGIAVVSAVGNDGPSGKPSYPAAFKGVIGITAVDAAGSLYANATRGAYVSLAAPGVDLLSTGPGGKTQLFTGTSAASAFASGAIALLLQQRPNLSLPDLQNLLQQTAKPLSSTAPNSEFGYGLVDVCRAMARLSNKQPTCR